MDTAQFDQLLTPIFVVDDQAKIIYHNHICSIFFQASPRVLSKFDNIGALIKQDKFDFQSEIKEALKENSAKVSPEINFKKQNNEDVTVICKIVPLDENRALINILDFSIEKKLHDKYKDQIKELRETHDQILKADKLTALGEMIAGISHEISSPLMIVSDRLDQLSDALDYKNIKESRKNLQDLDREYKRVLEIISGMKSFVKNQEEEMEIIDLHMVLEDVISFFDDLEPKAKIILDEATQKNKALVMGNKIKIQQVLINLVKNSLDSIVEGRVQNGEIHIGLADNIDSRTQSITVKDNGPGIPDDVQKNIFDMFFTTKEMTNGTGLGLSISKKIIEAHSGELNFVPHKDGCRFDIVLPNLEIGSFTLTNKYLTGEQELEDDVLLIVSESEEKLNQVYQVLKDKEYVLVFSHRLEGYTEYTEFMMVDKVLCLDQSIDSGELDEDIFDYHKLSMKQVLNKLEKEF